MENQTTDRNESSIEFLRKAKKTTISTLIKYGKHHPVIKYPVYALTFIFIFIYNHNP
jgi:hypothetical protein